MKTFQSCFYILLALTLFFGIKDLTVESVLRGVVDKGWGTVAFLLGGDIGGSQPRPLPPNQGDDSDSIQPIEELEDIE